MSRVYRQPAPSTTRRPPITRPTQPRPSPPPASTRSTTNRATVRGASTSTRGRTMHTERPQPQRNNDYSPYENNQSENQEQRTVHVGFVDSILHACNSSFFFLEKVIICLHHRQQYVNK